MAKKEDFIPTDLVKKLYGQGRTETDVIRQLRTQGFTPSQIDKALKNVPRPHVVKHEAYRGSLPAGLIRPTARAGAPESRMPAPLESTPLGAPIESITLPEELKPLDILAPAPHAAPHPSAAHEKGKEHEKIEHHVPLPAPVSVAPTGGAKISLEELVEKVVVEQEKKMHANLDKLESEHNSNVRKLADVSAKLDLLNVSVAALQKSLDDKSAFAGNEMKTISSKVAALETAFKELAHYFHKK